MVTDAKYECTGELDPDVTGTYEPIGPYDGKPSYKLTGKEWYLWCDGGILWNISAERGVLEGAYWQRPDPNIEGLYDPTIPATGDATITEI